MHDVNDLNDMQRYFVHEFVNEYQAGHMSRRDMMKRVLYITGGVASTATLLLSMGCQPATPAATATSAPKPTTPGSPATAATPVAGTAASPSASTVASPVASAAASPAASPATSPSPAASGVPGARSPLSVAPSDPAVDGRDITFPGNGVTLMAYEARPRNASGPLPVVLVCHENRGLTDHIRDVTRRFAKEGYLACSLDLLSRNGGTGGVTDPAQIPAMLSGSAAPTDRHVGDFQAAVTYYKSQSAANADRVGMTGYCFGGGVTWRATELIPDLKAAAPYYGGRPPLDQVSSIKAEILGVYSSDPQDFANNERDQLAAALTAAGVKYEIKAYPDTRHAFHNDTGGAYNEQSALAAWRDTLALFQRTLKV